MERSAREGKEEELRERTRAVDEYMRSQMPGCGVESADFRTWLMGLRCSIKRADVAGQGYNVLYLGDKEITRWSDESIGQLGALAPRAIGLAVLCRVSRARCDEAGELPQEDVSTEEFIHELQTHPRNRHCC